MIDASPWMASLIAGRYSAVIRGARGLRADGCIGAFHLELLGHVAQRTPEGIVDGRKLISSLLMRDLYDRAPELLTARDLWLDTASWFLHHELNQERREYSISSGKRIEELLLGELGLVRSQTTPEETAAFRALALIREGNLEGAFDLLFDASPGASSDMTLLQSPVFRRAGHTLFQAVPREQRLDVLRYKRGKPPCAYGLAPFPGRGFLIKEFVGTTHPGSQLLGKTLSKLAPIMTTGWIEGWTVDDGYPETEDFARVEALLTEFSRGGMAA